MVGLPYNQRRVMEKFRIGVTPSVAILDLSAVTSVVGVSIRNRTT